MYGLCHIYNSLVREYMIAMNGLCPRTRACVYTLVDVGGWGGGDSHRAPVNTSRDVSQTHLKAPQQCCLGAAAAAAASPMAVCVYSRTTSVPFHHVPQRTPLHYRDDCQPPVHTRVLYTIYFTLNIPQ